jgi:hypothetical protein
MTARRLVLAGFLFLSSVSATVPRAWVVFGGYSWPNFRSWAPQSRLSALESGEVSERSSRQTALLPEGFAAVWRDRIQSEDFDRKCRALMRYGLRLESARGSLRPCRYVAIRMAALNEMPYPVARQLQGVVKIIDFLRSAGHFSRIDIRDEFVA